MGSGTGTGGYVKCCIGSAGICIGFVGGRNVFVVEGRFLRGFRVYLGVGGGICAKYLEISARGPEFLVSICLTVSVSVTGMFGILGA